MTDQHSITPSPELVQQWWTEFERIEPDTDSLVFIATQAARWGADQELEGCCEWLQNAPFGLSLNKGANQLRFARRPKPPSLKEQALDELHISFDRGYLKEGAADTIRRALELLPND